MSHPSWQCANYRILGEVVRRPTFASEMPVAGDKLVWQIYQLNRTLVLAGRRIVGRWACPLNARVRHRERCYTLERIDG